MDDLEHLYINAVSMVTPVGGNAMMTWASVRAGVSAYKQSPIIGKNFTALKTAPVPFADEELWSPVFLMKNLYIDSAVVAGCWG